MADTATSFVRRSVKAAAGAGTRPGLHEQTLISTGLADLDRALGGGVPLQSVFLILEDMSGRQHLNILKYFLAEGIACRQSVCWLSARPPKGGPAQALPRLVVDTGKEDIQADEKNSGEGLRIAWQYRRYLKDKQQGPHGQGQLSTVPAVSRPSQPSSSSFRRAVGRQNSGAALAWSHTFDLTKAMGEEQMRTCDVVCEEVHSSKATLDSVQLFMDSLRPKLPAQVPSVKINPSVGRIAIQSLGGFGWMPQLSDEDREVAVLRCVFALKGLVRQNRCCAFVTCPAGLFSASLLQRLQHLCDGVLALESAAEDSEVLKFVSDPASCCGLLQVKRRPSLGSLVATPTDASLFVIRHKRKRITIDVIDVDPEAEQAEGGASSALGRTAASALCGGPPGKSSKYDF